LDLLFLLFVCLFFFLVFRFFFFAFLSFSIGISLPGSVGL
jgi:hypothetical protein